jgi:hypothetical protein
LDALTEPTVGNRYRRTLLLIGVLWLILAAVLAVFGLRSAQNVEVVWETATEQDTVGFDLYRRAENEGDYELISEDGFIASRGSTVSGASYTFSDEDVQPGVTYYYVLEEIETDGSRHRYDDDVLEYQVPSNFTWALILAGICMVIGLAMIVAGIKEGSE